MVKLIKFDAQLEWTLVMVLIRPVQPHLPRIPTGKAGRFGSYAVGGRPIIPRRYDNASQTALKDLLKELGASRLAGPRFYVPLETPPRKKDLYAGPRVLMTPRIEHDPEHGPQIILSVGDYKSFQDLRKRMIAVSTPETSLVYLSPALRYRTST